MTTHHPMPPAPTGQDQNPAVALLRPDPSTCARPDGHGLGGATMATTERS